MPLFSKKPKRNRVTQQPFPFVTPNPGPSPPVNQNHPGPGTFGRVSHSPATQSNDGSNAISPGVNAALSTFKSALTLLGKAPVVGIDVVTSVLLGVINGIQDMSQAQAGWQQMAERTERLWFLVSQSQGIDGGNEELCVPLIKALQKLADDLQRASTQGKLLAFFSGTDDIFSINQHRQALDSIIIDFTATICIATSRNARQVDADFQKAISEARAAAAAAGDNGSGGMVIMEDNVFDGIAHDVGVGNEIRGTARMVVDIRGNQFGHIGGSAFSHNIADSR